MVARFVRFASTEAIKKGHAHLPEHAPLCFVTAVIVSRRGTTVLHLDFPASHRHSRQWQFHPKPTHNLYQQMPGLFWRLLNHDDCLAVFFLQIVKNFKYHVDKARLKTNGWFIDQQDLWLHHKRTRDFQKPPFAA